MLNIMIAGNVGKDAEHKTTGKSELCTFSVAVNVGYGENRTTQWVDVTKWGNGAQGLAGILRKGSRVAVAGELSLREYNGKTYLQCRADAVTILSTPEMSGADRDKRHRDNLGSGPTPSPAGGGYEDLSDDIPF
jgi:single-strand DNA-binding protein